MKKWILLEIEVDEDIEMKYPNFNINYDSVDEFMSTTIGSYNAKIPIDETEVYINYHPYFDMDVKEANELIKYNDVGYRTKVLKLFHNSPICTNRKVKK